MIQRKKELLLDIDGFLVAQTSTHSLQEILDSKKENLPPLWQDYHINNVISLSVMGVIKYYLLLPNVIDMLGYLFIDLKEFLNVSFFSGGPEERNRKFAEILRQKIASKRKVPVDDIQYRLYSSKDCTKLACTDELQPSSANNPHIPVGCDSWNNRKTHSKKILATIFDFDLSDVILADNCFAVMTRDETDHHLKIPTFDNFSGSAFINYNHAIEDQKHLANKVFLERDPLFYKGNAACLLVGTIDAVIRFSIQFGTSAVSALNQIQICPITNKYRAAINGNPLYKKYKLDLYYEGFLRLHAINPAVKLLAPNEVFILEDLRAFCEEKFDDIFRYMQVTESNEYWNPPIAEFVSQNNVDSSSVSIEMKKIDLDTNETIDETENELSPVSHSQVRRHSLTTIDPSITAALIQQSVFSQPNSPNTQAPPDKESIITPLLSPSQLPLEPNNKASTCCVLL